MAARTTTSTPTATEPEPALDHLAAIRAEYGTYVATGPIDIDGARAFNEGDPVPNHHVENGLVTDDLVRARDTSTTPTT